MFKQKQERHVKKGGTKWKENVSDGISEETEGQTIVLLVF